MVKGDYTLKPSYAERQAWRQEFLGRLKIANDNGNHIAEEYAHGHEGLVFRQLSVSRANPELADLCERLVA